MSLKQKLEATFDIGAFGRIWFMNYYLTDVDIPTEDPLGKPFEVSSRFMKALVQNYLHDQFVLGGRVVTRDCNSSATRSRPFSRPSTSWTA